MYILKSWSLKLVQEAVGPTHTLHEGKRLPDWIVHPRNICGRLIADGLGDKVGEVYYIGVL